MLVHCGEERSRVITRPRRRKQKHPRYLTQTDLPQNFKQERR
ncbi:no significant blast hit [Histoplasma capsulatum]|uniref:No significant blast hit n=1 Tax=Ajellomyces capsulatus TaxID=5037 RepID=A0A8A1MFN2_AJECA|nr:no significant blast hit [Histoplasma capsulatum]